MNTLEPIENHTEFKENQFNHRELQFTQSLLAPRQLSRISYCQFLWPVLAFSCSVWSVQHLFSQEGRLAHRERTLLRSSDGVGELPHWRESRVKELPPCTAAESQIAVLFPRECSHQFSSLIDMWAVLPEKVGPHISG